eukprot:174120_1
MTQCLKRHPQSCPLSSSCVHKHVDECEQNEHKESSDDIDVLMWKRNAEVLFKQVECMETQTQKAQNVRKLKAELDKKHYQMTQMQEQLEGRLRALMLLKANCLSIRNY